MSEQEELKKYIYNILPQVDKRTYIFEASGNKWAPLPKCVMCLNQTTRYYAYYKQDNGYPTYKVIQNFEELQNANAANPIGVCCINEKQQKKMQNLIEKVNAEIRIQSMEYKIKEHHQRAQDLEKTLETEQQNLKRIKLDLSMDNLTL